MTPQAKTWLAVVAALSLLSACSAVEEKRQAYRQAEPLPPLQLPAGLDRPDERHALMVPELHPYEPPSAEPPPLVIE